MSGLSGPVDTRAMVHLDGASALQNLRAFLNSLGSGSGFGAVTTFAANDATPSVSDGTRVYMTANTSATSISTFDDATSGQFIIVYINDVYTTIADLAGDIQCQFNGSRNFSQGDAAAFFYDGSFWRQVWYHQHQPNIDTFADGDTTPSVATMAQVYRTSNTSATTITAFDGLVAGQMFIVEFLDNNTTVSTSANIRLSGGGSHSAQYNYSMVFYSSDGTVAREISRVD